jgi:hypothetical protein
MAEGVAEAGRMGIEEGMTALIEEGSQREAGVGVVIEEMLEKTVSRDPVEHLKERGEVQSQGIDWREALEIEIAREKKIGLRTSLQRKRGVQKSIKS